MEPQRRFAAVQWLRAFAALLVVAEHTKNEIAVHYLAVGVHDPRLAVFPFPAGVDIFFVISGFVMAYSSAPLYGQAGAWWRFLLRRGARIVPLYWLATIVLVGMFWVLSGDAWRQLTLRSLLASLSFIPATSLHGDGFPVLSIGWTLNYEALFYVLFAFSIGMPGRIALVAVSLALVGLVAYGSLGTPPSLPLVFWSRPIVLEFVAGIALHGLYAMGLRLPAVVRLLLVAAALALLAASVGEVSGWMRLVFWGGPAVLLVAAAVLGTAGSAMRPSARLADLVGNLSYGVYVTHLIVLAVLRNLIDAALPRTDWVWFALFPAAVVLLTGGCAFVLFRTVERPFLRWAKRATGVRLSQGPGAQPGP